MKILVDENIPFLTVRTLREMGHDVLDIRGTPQEGMKDEFLWTLCDREERLLITIDKGFTQRRNEPHYGVIVVRLRQPNLRKIHRRVMHALNQFEPHEWSGLLVVMRDYAQSTWRVHQ